MNTMLTNYVKDNQDDLDEWLKSVSLAYRTAEHSSTGISPFEMLYSRRARLPVDSACPIFNNDNGMSNKKYLSILKKSLGELQETRYLAVDRLNKRRDYTTTATRTQENFQLARWY